MKRDFIVESKMLLEKITMWLGCKTGYNQRTMIYVSSLNILDCQYRQYKNLVLFGRDIQFCKGHRQFIGQSKWIRRHERLGIVAKEQVLFSECCYFTDIYQAKRVPNRVLGISLVDEF